MTAPWRHTPEEREFNELTLSIRRGLEDGLPAEVLVMQGENALLRLAKFPQRSAEAYYLTGSAYYRLGQQKPPAYAKELWPRAVENLDRAIALEVAEKDRTAAQYRLGYALYQVGNDMPRAVELMTLAIDKGAEQPLQGYLLLVQANLKLNPPNLDGALTASRRILDLTPEGNPEAIGQARIELSELLMRKELWSDAQKELEQVSTKVSRTMRVKARLLQAQCFEEEGQGSQAVTIWNELLKDAAYVEGGRARIFYAIGLCYKEMDPPKIADAIKAWTEAKHLGGPAGQAAGLEMGELRLKLGEKEYGAALDDWKKAMEPVNAAHQFKNPYVKLDAVKQMFDRAIKLFQEKQDTQKSQEVSELYRKIAPGGTAEQKRAEAAEANALHMQKMGAAADLVAAQFRLAAEAYEQASKVESNADRTSTLWRSIQCYLSAKDTKQAQELLRQFVQMETNELRLGEGWFTLGDLYRGKGSKDNAVRGFKKCIEYPSSFAGRARYYLALYEIDDKNFEQARKLLDQNITGDTDNASQEKSQFKLASLLMQMREYTTASVELKKAVTVYPENPNVILAREQLGECYRRLAEQWREKEDNVKDQINKGNLTEERKYALQQHLRHYRHMRVEKLTNAAKEYEDLLDELSRRGRENRTLTAIEQILQRRARFGNGECQLDMEEFQEGLRVFGELQKQHRQTLESFYACLRICNVWEVYKASGSGPLYRERAKDALRLLAEDLKVMPADHELFRTPGMFTQEQWQTWAKGMETKLAAPVKEERPKLFQE